jgi:membrane-bound acyltransferase YfiQ involved in biofilm formation
MARAQRRTCGFWGFLAEFMKKSAFSPVAKDEAHARFWVIKLCFMMGVSILMFPIWVISNYRFAIQIVVCPMTRGYF